MPYLTAALYKFVELPDHADMQAPLLACCEANGVKGTLLLAAEGINGTIAGPEAGVRAVLAWLRSDPRLAALEHKEAWAEQLPFYRMKVRLKREIVTMGVPDVHPALMAGQYVKPADWNRLLAEPDVVLVDTRNDYEVSIGTFEGAINPATSSFSELPGWVEREMADGGKLAPVNGKKPRVAMFCTGGIRCEKSTALMRSHGFDEVYHLEGGILKYLETVPEVQSRWQGECFVFDERVSVGHGLAPGKFTLCRSCRDPLGDQDRASPLYELGVSCAHCHGKTSEEQKAGYRERQRQVELAQARRQAHIGIPSGVRKAGP
ncbi:MAG: rhodanese-related sulfurtransferase [Polaromonas sp.]|nr:rhodanese-related sulfurtransferase [Polaromonas sp.]